MSIERTLSMIKPDATARNITGAIISKLEIIAPLMCSMGVDLSLGIATVAGAIGEGYKPLQQPNGNPSIIKKQDFIIMSIERTLSMIKPDATARNITGAIISKLEQAGLRVIAQKRVKWSEAQAQKFYEVHKERPFYNDLVAFMTSGPIVQQVLEGENAIAKNREIMGATNPEEAAAGTIRAEFAENIERNSVHGSDSAENAAIEIALCFDESEIVG